MCFDLTLFVFSLLRKRGFGTTPKRSGIHSKPQLQCIKLAFHSFWNPSMYTHACVCICRFGACVRIRVSAYAYVCLRMHVLGFPWPLFSKTSFIQLIKELYFPKKPSLSQFQSDRALNQPWVLEFYQPWFPSSYSSNWRKLNLEF